MKWYYVSVIIAYCTLPLHASSSASSSASAASSASRPSSGRPLTKQEADTLEKQRKALAARRLYEQKQQEAADQRAFQDETSRALKASEQKDKDDAPFASLSSAAPASPETQQNAPTKATADKETKKSEDKKTKENKGNDAQKRKKTFPDPVRHIPTLQELATKKVAQTLYQLFARPDVDIVQAWTHAQEALTQVSPEKQAKDQKHDKDTPHENAMLAAIRDQLVFLTNYDVCIPLNTLLLDHDREVIFSNVYLKHFDSSCTHFVYLAQQLRRGKQVGQTLKLWDVTDNNPRILSESHNILERFIFFHESSSVIFCEHTKGDNKTIMGIQPFVYDILTQKTSPLPALNAYKTFLTQGKTPVVFSSDNTVWILNNPQQEYITLRIPDGAVFAKIIFDSQNLYYLTNTGLFGVYNVHHKSHIQEKIPVELMQHPLQDSHHQKSDQALKLSMSYAEPYGLITIQRHASDSINSMIAYNNQTKTFLTISPAHAGVLTTTHVVQLGNRTVFLYVAKTIENLALYMYDMHTQEHTLLQNIKIDFNDQYIKLDTDALPTGIALAVSDTYSEENTMYQITPNARIEKIGQFYAKVFINHTASHGMITHKHSVDFVNLTTRKRSSIDIVSDSPLYNAQFNSQGTKFGVFSHHFAHIFGLPADIEQLCFLLSLHTAKNFTAPANTEKICTHLEQKLKSTTFTLYQKKYLQKVLKRLKNKAKKQPAPRKNQEKTSQPQGAQA